MVPGRGLTVDTAEVDEVAARLSRVIEEVQDAGGGLADLRGVQGLAVGAEAVFDALSDLSRRWTGGTASLAADAAHLRLLLEQAAVRYASCEGEVSGLLCLPGNPGGTDPRAPRG